MGIFVTGADGFIGSHLTEALVRAGDEVRAFVFYNSFNSWRGGYSTRAMYSDGFRMRLQGAEPFCIRPGYPLTSTRSAGWLR